MTMLLVGKGNSKISNGVFQLDIRTESLYDFGVLRSFACGRAITIKVRVIDTEYTINLNSRP